MNPRMLNRVSLVLAVVGLFIAGYLSLNHHSGTAAACGASTGCSQVAAWVKQNWNNFPVADLGLIAYAFLAALALFRAFKGINAGSIRPGLIFSALGAVISIVLTGLAFVVIQAQCTWCLASAITMVALAVVHFLMAKAPAIVENPEAPAQPNTQADLILAGVLGIALIGGPGVSGAGVKKPLTTESKVAQKRIDDFIKAQPIRLGPEKAPFILVEYYDLFCPYCRQTYQASKNMAEQANGQLQVIFRHFPLTNLPGHEYSELSSIIGEIMNEKGKYFQFVDALMTIEPKETRVEDILAICEGLGVTADEIRKRAADENDPAFVRYYEDKKLADELGMNTTPTFFFAKKGEMAKSYDNNTYRDAMLKAGLFGGMKQ